MLDKLKEAKDNSYILASLSSDIIDSVLIKMADALNKNNHKIIEQNSIDLENANKANLPSSIIDRLVLNESRISNMANALVEIASLDSPISRVLDGWTTKDGLDIQKISVPIGVIGIIYESRPNVTSDTAGLCLKSGNICLLKGGKEARYSNKIIIEILQKVLIENSLPKNLIFSIDDGSRESVAKLITYDKYLDLIIPRGGEGLIKFVNENSKIPIIKHDKGLCHTYIDKFADKQMALDISINAKCQRSGVCNAMETLLVHKDIAQSFIPKIAKELQSRDILLKGCAKTIEIYTMQKAIDIDWDTEYLDNILSIKIVDSIKVAIAHINRYGSSHSEAIITNDYNRANKFLKEVDASCCYVNASTRFTDGGSFGLGAEVGISTSKLHSRGPMGIKDLTTYKYIIRGSGNVRDN
jgi:glutamate-5-semialdehyde dehydrogenase